MRLIKMFGLAALAAVAAMVFVGATSAMAENTTLCLEDTNELGCAEPAGQASHVHFTTLVGEPAKVLTSSANVECTALYLGLTLGLGAPLVIHGNFTYSSCAREGGGGCTVTELSSSALTSFLKVGVEEAEVKLEFEILVECSIFIHCVYNGTGLTGHGLGSLQNGHAKIANQTLNKVRGFLCPKTSKLSILTGSLTALYIRN